jgi:hypothetical protein
MLGPQPLRIGVGLAQVFSQLTEADGRGGHCCVMVKRVLRIHPAFSLKWQFVLLLQIL